MRFNIVIFSLLSIIIFAFSDWIAFALAPGLSDVQHQLSSNILKVLSIFILLSNFCGIGIGLLEYKLKFEKSALISFMQAVLAVAILYIGSRFVGIYSVPAAHIFSLILVSFIYLFTYLRGGNGFRTTLKLYNDFIKQYISLLVPIIVASFFVWLIHLSDMFIASYFKTGSVSYINYSQRIITYFSIVSTTICTIYFPLLSKLNNKNDNAEFTRIFYKGLQTLFAVGLSVSVFICLFSNPIISILLERGNFKSQDTEIVSTLLILYSLYLLCSPMGNYLANAYYCRLQPKIATIYSIISSVTNIILNCILGYYYGIFGLAIASSLSLLLGNILQISNIRKVNSEYRLSRSLNKLKSPFIAGILNLVVFYVVREQFPINTENIFTTIIFLSAYGLSFFCLYFLWCTLFNVEIAREIVNKLKQTIQK